MINVDYPELLQLFSEHLDPKRSESASFLIWYLENYYRLDTLEAIDSVCDQSGDKGVDGIFVNDNDQTITVFQSKISQRSTSIIGDASLRAFSGTLTQFIDSDALANLLASAGDAQVAALIKRTDLLSKIDTYDVRGEFVTNINVDSNGMAFLAGTSNVTFVGKHRLVSEYISPERTLPKRKSIFFDILGFQPTEYIVDSARKSVIAPIRAAELVSLDGIADQSLLSFNVRGPLGRTKVNKDIVRSIRDTNKHKLFPLFHNGITVIAGTVDVDENSILVDEYYVVNGCQSLTALFNNKSDLTDDLRILVKFIKMDPSSADAATITQYSNNQNGVRARDFKSNTQIQVRLQNEFRQHYTGAYCYEIKTGESGGSGDPISNELAGLYLMAFDLREPWATHRKYAVFEDKHAELFGRPEVTADRIVLCHIIGEVISSRISKIDNQLFAKYALTKFMMLYMIRLVLDGDPLGAKIISEPNAYVRSLTNRQKLILALGTIVDDLVVDINGEVQELGPDFDYRDKLRDSNWVQRLATTVLGFRSKMIARRRIRSFEAEWAAIETTGANN